MMNVAQYFDLSFQDFLDIEGNEELKADLATMPLDTTCGDDCKAVIDAGSVFAHHVRRAIGDDQPDWIRDIAWTAARTSQCFICG